MPRMQLLLESLATRLFCFSCIIILYYMLKSVKYNAKCDYCVEADDENNKNVMSCGCFLVVSVWFAGSLSADSLQPKEKNVYIPMELWETFEQDRRGVFCRTMSLSAFGEGLRHSGNASQAARTLSLPASRRNLSRRRHC